MFERASDRIDVPSVRRAGWLAMWAVIGFIGLTIVVETRSLAARDLAITINIQVLAGTGWDAIGGLAALLFSSEGSFILAGAIALALWRRGAGWWVLVPFGFVLLYPVELGMKLCIDQPTVPAPLQREISYPLFQLTLRGSFPSGHALRTGYLCTLVGVLVAPYLGRLASPAVVFVGVLIGVMGFTRIYLGYHWTSDVIAGLLLGWALALPLAIAAGSAVYDSSVVRRDDAEVC
ncbi:MAG: hypothetical protein QOF51_1710 [Chloroflexota bacterium]|jgi:undecaprenyl-diphosphatase|nr:hypothetical protein [Chloroflexota bacterium]